jgi:hypothetical protein
MRKRAEMQEMHDRLKQVGHGQGIGSRLLLLCVRVLVPSKYLAECTSPDCGPHPSPRTLPSWVRSSRSLPQPPHL